MATLLSLLAAVVTAVVCMLVYDASIAVLLVLIPISVVIFCISLLIGHFLSEPLSDLAKKMAAFRSGAPVTFEPDGRMYEADLLTSDFKRLVQTTIPSSSMTLPSRSAAKTSSSATSRMSCARRWR